MLNYIEYFFILVSAGPGCISISLLGTAIGIKSSVKGLTTAGIKKYESVIKKKEE